MWAPAQDPKEGRQTRVDSKVRPKGPRMEAAERRKRVGTQFTRHSRGCGRSNLGKQGSPTHTFTSKANKENTESALVKRQGAGLCSRTDQMLPPPPMILYQPGTLEGWCVQCQMSQHTSFKLYHQFFFWFVCFRQGLTM